MLMEYQVDAKKKSIAFNDITLDFYHDFKRFMVEVKKYNENTQNKHTGLLKFFLNEATERKENDNIEFKSRRFSTPRKEVDSIYLDEDEIKLLMKLDLSAEPRLEKVEICSLLVASLVYDFPISQPYRPKTFRLTSSI
jgi:hypothetical protein